MSENRNILFITLDQWRAECLSVLNHNQVKTPNIDALATDGVLFKQHYCQALPCGPSRASIYTGMYQHNHRSICNGTPLNSKFTNIALELRKAGYEPALFGYTDTSMDPSRFHQNDPLMNSYEKVLPGFDAQVLLDEDALPWIADLKAKGYEFASGEVLKPKQNDVNTNQHGRTYAPALFSAQDSSAAFLTNEVIKYLSVRQSSNWFAHVSYISPHHPYIVPEPYYDMINPVEVSGPLRKPTMIQEMAQHPYLQHYLPNPCGKGCTYNTCAIDNLTMDEKEIRQARATYYAMISEVDFHLGRLINYLKQLGVYQNTLIIITSDHGDQLGDHWQFGKHSYFDQSLHIPLIIRDPVIAADSTRGQQLSCFTESIDIMPGIMQWLDLTPPVQCDGVSLQEVIYTGIIPDGWRTEVHTEFDFRDIQDTGRAGRGVADLKHDECSLCILRDEHFKYVHFSHWPALLFDLDQDPEEFNNLAENPEYQNTVLKYAQKLLSWRMQNEDKKLANIKLTTHGLEEYAGQ